MPVVARTNLSRELIARTALAMTDEVGLAGLSMRKLGSELGVEAMSLYHYVENKADLLDAILACLFAEIDLPVDVSEHDWESAIRRGMLAFRDVLIGHQGALELFSSRPATGQAAFDVVRWSCGRFEAVGLDIVESSHALHFAVSFVMGHVASEQGAMTISRDPDRQDDLVVGSDPETAEFIRKTRVIQPDEMFVSGLDAVVAGLRAMYHLP